MQQLSFIKKNNHFRDIETLTYNVLKLVKVLFILIMQTPKIIIHNSVTNTCIHSLKTLKSE